MVQRGDSEHYKYLTLPFFETVAINFGRPDWRGIGRTGCRNRVSVPAVALAHFCANGALLRIGHKREVGSLHLHDDTLRCFVGHIGGESSSWLPKFGGGEVN